jgi:hypothetical protein
VKYINEAIKSLREKNLLIIAIQHPDEQGRLVPG